jgi:DNA-binding transcriptional ArsR family regulator
MAYPLAEPFQSLAGPARGRLIQVLRAAPRAGMHMRELSRVANLSLSSLQRELERLSSLGLLNRTESGKQVLYSLRREDPFVRLLLAAEVVRTLKGVHFEQMPAERQRERSLVELCAYVPPDAGLWRNFGDPVFLAGVAVILAGHAGFDRAGYLALAQSLSAGATRLEQHEAWHARNRPNLPRLFSMIDRERRTHG